MRPHTDPVQFDCRAGMFTELVTGSGRRRAADPAPREFRQAIGRQYGRFDTPAICMRGVITGTTARRRRGGCFRRPPAALRNLINDLIAFACEYRNRPSWLAPEIIEKMR